MRSRRMRTACLLTVCLWGSSFWLGGGAEEGGLPAPWHCGKADTLWTDKPEWKHHHRTTLYGNNTVNDTLWKFNTSRFAIEIFLQFTIQSVSFRTESIISNINLGSVVKRFEVSRDEADFVDSYSEGIGIQILKTNWNWFVQAGSKCFFYQSVSGPRLCKFTDNNILRCYIKDLKAVDGTFTERQP